MLKISLFEKWLNTAENLAGETKTLFFLFRRERVFYYFLLIVLLMLVSGLLFLRLENAQILAAHPASGTNTAFDKLVTSMYWAIVTIASCGYGDITPATNAGRLLVIIVLFTSVAMVSMFTAITVSKTLISALVNTKLAENLWLFGAPKKKEKKLLPIIANRKIAYIISGTLLLAAIIGIPVFGLKLGLDFTGGTLMEFKFAKP